MTEEIKEILESLNKIAKAEYYPEDLLTYKECEILLNYITNLQKENENLLYEINGYLKEKEKLKDELYSTNQVVNELLDIQSRNEKAVEYIKDSGITFLNLANQRYFCNNNCADKILNILEGGDEE